MLIRSLRFLTYKVSIESGAPEFFMERLCNEIPLFRCQPSKGHTGLYENESDIFRSPHGVGISIDCPVPDRVSGSLIHLNITSHRVILVFEGDYLAIRLDQLGTVEIRKKLFSTPRIDIRFTQSEYVLTLKIKDDQFVDTLHQVLTRLISRRPWVELGGYVERVSIGGLNKISTKLSDHAARTEASTDAGLADLMSLKKFATELKDTIDKLNSSSTDADRAAYKTLVEEYGLSTNAPSISDSSSGSRIESMIDQAIAVHPAGIMFAHDLFCLVNRALKLETVLCPKNFMTIIKNISSSNSSIAVMSIDDYTLVYRKSKFDMKAIEKLVSTLDFVTVGNFAKLLKVTDLRLARSLLARLELDTGIICRDNGGQFGDLVFFKNTYFR